jgi:hypothetical protein
MPECRVCNKIVATWVCWKCYQKLRKFEEEIRKKVESLWTDEYREELAQDYLATSGEKVVFT